MLAGGRGLGTFKNGFKGGVHIVKADQVEETAGIEHSSVASKKLEMYGFCCFLKH